MVNTIEQKIQEFAHRVADELGFALVEVSLLGSGKRTLLRVIIDKEGGITLDDCATYSRRFEGFMDVENLITQSYTLEVSSPGLDRPLRTLDDFKKNIGKLVRITTKEMIDNRTFFQGRLKDIRDNVLSISLFEKRGTPEEIDIPYDKIARAQLEIEVN
ncbi:MAG TPA: ribosome maturation factor [Nitrospiraceae bacterium]|jgi:ribosome maturation factor RimP|nr:ribosome maturation factor [Nitrospiraceae bacterium]